MRVDLVEMIQNFQKDKNKILEEWESLKNMKQDLIELIESSNNKEKIWKNQTQESLDNFEMQISELKNTINTLHKIKKDNNKNYNYNQNHMIKSDKTEPKINNNEKTDIFILHFSNNEKNAKNEKNDKSEKNNIAKRVQSSKTFLQNYIEGNSLYQELIKQNSLRCEKHKNDTSEQSMHLIMRKYYDEDL